MTEIPVPKRIHRADDAVTVTWSENHVSTFASKPLRLECHCAECRDEMTGIRLLNPATVPEEIIPVSISLVGAYAIKIEWSDGHDSGIYAFDSLMAICPCETCTAKRDAAAAN